MAGMEIENRDTCKTIALEIEAYQEGRMYRCPECGEAILIDEDDVNEEENTYVCSHCETASDFDDYDQLSIED